jgi:hypothetical protein
VNRLVEQMLKAQEDGLTVSESISSLPPCVITLGAEAEAEDVPPDCTRTVQWIDKDTGETRQQKIGMVWEGKHTHWRDTSLLGAVAREVIATAVRLKPYLNVTLDGGTWSSITGVRVSAEKSSFFDSCNRYEHARPFEWVWLEKGDSVRAYCERKRPGDAAFLKLALWGLRTSQHGAARLGKITREPPRVPRTSVDDDVIDVDDDVIDAQPPPPAFGNARQRAAAAERANEVNRATLTGDGAEALTTWADKRTRDLGPNLGQLAWLNGYVPAIDADASPTPLAMGEVGPRGRRGFELPLLEPTFVRLPAVPEKMGSRPLPDAVWGDMPVVAHACLCILHAAMRSGEHLFTRLLSVRCPSLPPHVCGACARRARGVRVARVCGACARRACGARVRRRCGEGRTGGCGDCSPPRLPWRRRSSRGTRPAAA